LYEKDASKWLVKLTEAVKYSAMTENFRKGENFDWYGFQYPSNDTCRARVTKDIAILEIFFGNQFVTQAEQSVTKTFSEKFSDVGK
jgi:hypothetical protein